MSRPQQQVGTASGFVFRIERHVYPERAMRGRLWWRLSRDEARERARRHVEGRGLPWTEPVRVYRRPLGGWNVVTNSDRRGGNVFVTVTRRGEVRGGTGVTPR